MKVVLRDKGRITLPAKIREALGLREGDRLEVTTQGGAVLLRPRQVVRVEDLEGILGTYEVEIEDVERALGRKHD